MKIYVKEKKLNIRVKKIENIKKYLKKTPKTMTRTKKALQQKETPTSSNFSTLLSSDEDAALADMIGSMVIKELQAN